MLKISKFKADTFRHIFRGDHPKLTKCWRGHSDWHPGQNLKSSILLLLSRAMQVRDHNACTWYDVLYIVMMCSKILLLDHPDELHVIIWTSSYWSNEDKWLITLIQHITPVTHLYHSRWLVVSHLNVNFSPHSIL